LPRTHDDTIVAVLVFATVPLAAIGVSLAAAFVHPRTAAGWLIAVLLLPAIAMASCLVAMTFARQWGKRIEVSCEQVSETVIQSAHVLTTLGPAAEVTEEVPDEELWSYPVGSGTLALYFERKPEAAGRLRRIAFFTTIEPSRTERG
jgi:hypothetical protein